MCIDPCPHVLCTRLYPSQVVAKYADSGFTRDALANPPKDPTDRPEWIPTTRRGKAGKWLMDNYIYPLVFVAACIIGVSKYYEWNYPSEESVPADVTNMIAAPA